MKTDTSQTHLVKHVTNNNKFLKNRQQPTYSVLALRARPADECHVTGLAPRRLSPVPGDVTPRRETDRATPLDDWLKWGRERGRARARLSSALQTFDIRDVRGPTVKKRVRLGYAHRLTDACTRLSWRLLRGRKFAHDCVAALTGLHKNFVSLDEGRPSCCRCASLGLKSSCKSLIWNCCEVFSSRPFS